MNIYILEIDKNQLIPERIAVKCTHSLCPCACLSWITEKSSQKSMIAIIS